MDADGGGRAFLTCLPILQQETVSQELGLGVGVGDGTTTTRPLPTQRP
jgi:hypothetical protein